MQEASKDIAVMSEEAGYGSGFYIRYFYEMYLSIAENRQQLVDASGDNENRQQTVDDFDAIFQIPWAHHVQILGRCKGNPEKAITNFNLTLQEDQSELVQAITKDPYNFDLIIIRE